MTELTSTRIKAHATKLGLPHLAASLEQLVARAGSEQLGYLDFLDLIVEEELGIRDGRRFRQALRLSKLPHHKTLDEFDYAFQPDLDVRKVKRPSQPVIHRHQQQYSSTGSAGGRENTPRGRISILPGRALDLLHQPRRYGPPTPRRRGTRPPQPKDACLHPAIGARL
jgi:hypothetical protein